MYGQPFMPGGITTGTPPLTMGQPMSQRTMPGVSYRVRPVTDYMQAAALPPEFDGSITLMPDLGHGVVYTKQLNPNDGTAIFNAYKLYVPEERPAAPEYITPEQFQAGLAALSEKWEQRLAGLAGEPPKMAGKGSGKA